MGTNPHMTQPQTPPPGAVQPESWWTRNFFWFAPLLALLFVVSVVFVCMGLFTVMTGLGQVEPLRDLAYERVVAHPAVQNRMPGEIEMGRGFQGPIRADELEQVPLRIPIRTEDAAAEIHVLGTRDDDDAWRMRYLAVEFTGGDRIVLIGDEAAPPEVFDQLENGG